SSKEPSDCCALALVNRVNSLKPSIKSCPAVSAIISAVVPRLDSSLETHCLMAILPATVTGSPSENERKIFSAIRRYAVTEYQEVLPSSHSWVWRLSIRSVAARRNSTLTVLKSVTTRRGRWRHFLEQSVGFSSVYLSLTGYPKY